MSFDRERLEGLLGAGAVEAWQPPSAAFAGFLPVGTTVALPQDVEQVQECLRFAARERLRVLPAGSMEHLHVGGVPGAIDFVLSLRRLNRVLEYEPEDLTMAAEAGVTLHEIARRSGAAGQRLAPSPWPGVAATLGGACAANRSGSCRASTGTLRDAVLGCKVVHADGSMTRSGGKVVKNVSGYDLPKLYVGSMGSLAMFTEINVRLVPCPEASAVVQVRLPLESARNKLLTTHRGTLRPAALVVVHSPGVHGNVQLLARFEGRESVVRAQAEACAREWGGEVLAAAADTWEAVERHAEPRPDAMVLQLASLPVGVCDLLTAVADTCGNDTSAVALFGVGTCSVQLPRAQASSLEALQQRLATCGGSLRRIEDPGGEWLAPPAQLPALQFELKALFDPESRLRPALFAHAEGES